MMGQEIIEKLFDYNYWANRRILACAAGIDEANFEAPTDLGHGSLRDTLFHMLRTEQMWRMLCEYSRLEPAGVLRSQEYATLDRIAVAWREEEAHLHTFLAGLSDEELGETVEVENRDGRRSPMVRWQMLTHAILHSMQHRSEAAAMLTRYGHSPGDLDFVFFAMSPPAGGHPGDKDDR